jgi:hypothetical protein
MQGVLQPAILKRLFLLLARATDQSAENGFFEHQVHGDTLIIGVANNDVQFKTRFKQSLEKLKIPSSQLALTHFDQYGISAMGLILRHFEESIIPKIRDCFTQLIEEQRHQTVLEMA